MTEEQLENLSKYGLLALLGALIATGLQLGVMLTGTADIAWRPLAATFVTTLFGSLATAFGSSRLVRAGSEGIAAQVDALREKGVPRREMVVVDGTDAPDPDRLTPAQAVQVADILEARMKATKAAPRTRLSVDEIIRRHEGLG